MAPAVKLLLYYIVNILWLSHEGFTWLYVKKSDDVERRLRLRNTRIKRRRHGYESQTSTAAEWEEGRPVDA